MAWSNTPLATGMSAALALDRPILVGSNVCDSPATPAEWNTDTGSFAETDRSESGYPAYRAHDRIAHSGMQTRGAAAISDNEWFLLFDANFPAATFDCAALLNHNLAGISGISLQYQIADNNTFSSNLATIATITPSGARNFTLFSVRYLGGGFLRIRITASGDFVPRLGDVWFGRRRQLRADVKEGFDIDALSSTHVLSNGMGVSHATSKTQGRRNIEIAITPNDKVSTLVDTDSVRSWWSECGYGTKPFLWAPNPTSAPNDIRVMTSNDESIALTRANQGANRTFSRSWRELPPLVSAA